MSKYGTLPLAKKNNTKTQKQPLLHKKKQKQKEQKIEMEKKIQIVSKENESGVSKSKYEV